MESVFTVGILHLSHPLIYLNLSPHQAIGSQIRVNLPQVCVLVRGGFENDGGPFIFSVGLARLVLFFFQVAQAPYSAKLGGNNTKFALIRSFFSKNGLGSIVGTSNSNSVT